MASRFSAARPKRAGEAFARARHGEDRDENGPTSKKVKFDIRNPSALAPSAQDEDDENDNVLDADVIGASGRATKRGAVNLEGYDSDSENEYLTARAEARGKKGREAEDVDLAEVMDSYNNSKATPAGGDVEDEEEVDMFNDADADAGETTLVDRSKKGAKKDKQVRFLAQTEIEGQEDNSKSGGTVRIDGREESDDEDDEEEEDDEEAIAAAIEEEGVDEEVGAGGLKKHAPKIDAFNMKAEQEEGAFDEAGNYIRKAADEEAVHDRWLEGISRKEMKKAAAAHEKREAELRKLQRENDSLLTGDLFKELIIRLEPGETALDALARLRKGQTTKPKAKKVPKWKQKRSKANVDGAGDAMDVEPEKEPEDPRQVKIRETINAIADAADKLMQRDFANIYDTERERLIREYRNETGEAWVEPPEPDGDENGGGAGETSMWEFRWTDGRDDAAKQGPFDGPTMKAWHGAGYFGEGVEFQRAGEDGEWTRVAMFL
ncbi:hypothetical protein N658DRAFT_496700 [Parathielavia hyrcaniae]|uniref:GYF domain-containing protein n=1 Tax=Parathielavia hyrcaniae TaxID=113614 RepID=A0AAN6PZU3_9PEZI|nr:hypothetical protein N658DRAFT_496700 [Parathielavia hyrcaniae]